MWVLSALVYFSLISHSFSSFECVSAMWVCPSSFGALLGVISSLHYFTRHHDIKMRRHTNKIKISTLMSDRWGMQTRKYCGNMKWFHLSSKFDGGGGEGGWKPRRKKFWISKFGRSWSCILSSSRKHKNPDAKLCQVARIPQMVLPLLMRIPEWLWDERVVDLGRNHQGHKGHSMEESLEQYLERLVQTCLI